MSAVSLGVAAALVALRCQLITDDPYVLGSVSRVLPATRPAFLRALNGTRRLIGCPVSEDVPPPPPPFVGGQCDGELYVVNGAWDNQVGTPSTWNPQLARGPIGGVRKVASPAGQANGFELFCRGTTTGNCGSTPPILRPPDWYLFADLSVIRNNPRITSITKCSGVDNCGSVPPDYPPPIDRPINIDVTYNIDNGDEVTVNIPFIFAPITANFNGTLRIPFTFDLGGLEFSGDINLPDFNVTVNPPGITPGSGDDTTPVGGDEPGETVPPVPPDEKIIGVVVNASDTESGKVSSYSSPGIPNIFAPRLGSVKFAYSLGAATFWSSDIDIKGDRTFIECPFSQGADAVVASPQPGVTLTFVPIRGFPLATTGDIPRPA